METFIYTNSSFSRKLSEASGTGLKIRKQKQKQKIPLTPSCQDAGKKIHVLNSSENPLIRCLLTLRIQTIRTHVWVIGFPLEGVVVILVKVNADVL